MGRVPRIVLPILASAILGACAGTAPGGRSQWTAPASVSSLYSSIDMNLQLATATPIASACTGAQCKADKAFERQVARLGGRLAQTAFDLDPQLKERIPAFNFAVAEKSEAGSTSDASGSIVIFRGVRESRPDEAALAYLIAREMGCVIARHHDEKSATTVLTTVLAQLLVPALSLTGGVAFLATSAASMMGTKAITASTTDDRAQEADAIALKLLARTGWSSPEVGASLSKYARSLGDDSWSQEVRDSASKLTKRKEKTSLALADKTAWPHKQPGTE
ncbi:MAG TPA: hypothetical protein VFF82_12640 [Rhodocyclaceae bacterium]|nr:hypothetical protein [Rhodocyclaceae bacterium]